MNIHTSSERILKDRTLMFERQANELEFVIRSYGTPQHLKSYESVLALLTTFTSGVVNDI